MASSQHAAGWTTKQLVDCTSDGNISYGIVQPGRHVEGGIPILRVNNFRSGVLDSADALRVSGSVERDYQRTRLKGGELLLTLVGSVGQTAIVSSDYSGWNVARAIAVIRPSEDLSAKWLAICLQSVEARHFLDGRANTTVQKTLNLGDVKQVPILIPPRETRLRIESMITSLDDKIDLNRRINQTLEVMAQAIFKSWFVDFDPVKAKIAAKTEGRDPLRAAMTSISGIPDTELDTLPPDQFATLAATAELFPDEMEESTLGEIPKGWRSSTLGEQCGYLNRGISPKYIDEGGVLVLNQKCIRDFSLDPSKGRRHDPNQRNVSGRELQLGDVLVNSTGVGTLGRVAQVLRLDEPTIVDSHVTVVRSGPKLNSAYLGQWFVTKQPDVEAMGEGSTGQTELSRGKLASMTILVPEQAVLGAFAAAVSPLQSLISTQARESLVLQETRDALLPRLLSGELQPTVALEGVDA